MVPVKKSRRPLYWASAAFGACLAVAAWFVLWAYTVELPTIVHCAGDSARSVLQWACKKNLYLLRFSTDEVNELNARAGATLAVQLEDKEEAERMLKFFLSRGVDINGQDIKTNDAGQTALHKAVHANAPEEVALLLAHGAKVDVRNGQYQTPLELARELQQQNPSKDRSQVITMLVNAGRPKYSGFVRQN